MFRAIEPLEMFQQVVRQADLGAHGLMALGERNAELAMVPAPCVQREGALVTAYRSEST